MAVRGHSGITGADRRYTALDHVQDAVLDLQVQLDEEREKTRDWEDQHDVVLAKLWQKQAQIASLRSVNAIKDDTIAIQARRSAGKDKDLADLKRLLADRDKTIAEQGLLISSLRR